MKREMAADCGPTDPDLWLRLRWSDLKPIHSSSEEKQKEK